MTSQKSLLFNRCCYIFHLKTRLLFKKLSFDTTNERLVSQLIMELRSGRILKEDEQSIHDIFECLTKSHGSENWDFQKVMKDMTAFFRFLFYHISVEQGKNEIYEQLKKNDMLLSNYGESLRDPTSFWTLLGMRIRKRVRAQVPHQEMTHAIKIILEEEYQLKPEDPSFYDALCPLIRYIVNLYKTDSYHGMVHLMNEEKQLRNRALFQSRDNKLYLNELAKFLARLITTNVKNQYNIPWFSFLKKAKQSVCFDSSIGCTVVRLTSRKTLFHYEIKETGEKFFSPEPDVKKALLLHARCTQKPPSY